MISAYTISQLPMVWNLPHVPWYNGFDNTQIDKYRKTLDYVKYLAAKRNRAVNELLAKYPETTDILCCDSHYLDQTRQLNTLILDYEKLADTILGAAIYGPWRQRARDVFKPRTTFSDPWGVPDLAWTRPDRTGLVDSTGVSGVHVFPVKAWLKGVRYQAYPETNTGTETTFLARNSGLHIKIDMDAMFYRERLYSHLKCIRCSLGLRSRLSKWLS